MEIAKLLMGDGVKLAFELGLNSYEVDVPGVANNNANCRRQLLTTFRQNCTDEDEFLKGIKKALETCSRRDVILSIDALGMNLT